MPALLLALWASSLPGALSVRIVRGDVPHPSLRVALESPEHDLESETDLDGVARFLGVPPGAYRIRAGGLEWDLALSSELESLTLDLDAPGNPVPRFGRTALPR